MITRVETTMREVRAIRNTSHARAREKGPAACPPAYPARDIALAKSHEGGKGEEEAMEMSLAKDAGRFDNLTAGAASARACAVRPRRRRVT